MAEEPILNKYQLSEIQRKTFTNAFLLFDKLKSGFIPVTDFPALFRSIGQNPTEADIARIQVSFNGAESFDLSAFISICESPELKPPVSLDTLLESFRHLDKDASQTLTIPKLRQLLQLQGEKLPIDLANSFIEYANTTCDPEKTGLMNYEALVRALISKDPGVTWITE